jgi:branched-chain amino acid transport system permease protein
VTRAAHAGLVVLLLAFATAPFLVNPGLVFIAGLAMIEIVFSLSWNLLFSYVGLVSFGHAAFFGVGAYTAAVALKYGYDIHFLLVLLMGVVLGAISAFLVAIVVLRRASGIQFSVLTLALSQLVVTLIGYSDFLGHDEGLAALARPQIDLGLFVIDLNRPLQCYYFVFVLSLVAIGLMWLILHGHLGRTMRAVRIDAERAAFIGINVWRVRVFAFTVSGAFAALAGTLLAPWARIVTTDYVIWVHSAQPIFATLLGGTGFFWGPLIGVLALDAVNYATRTLAGLSEVLVGASLIALILLAPQGVLGFARDRLAARQARL